MTLPKKICLAFLILLSLFLLSTSRANKVKADVPGSGEDCTTLADCVSQYGQGNWLCIGGICRQPLATSSIQKFQEEQQRCAKEGIVTVACWIGGSSNPRNPNEEYPGIVENLLNSFSTAVAGPVYLTHQPGGAIGGIMSLTALLYANPPASGVDYLADLEKNFSFSSPVYAQQGIGFKYFTPILPVWKLTRNLAYLSLVIIFIVTGLAIMFRVKISPQAVLSIESALPNLVIALILITFSYAIVGFLIDIIYVLIGISIAVFKDYLTGTATHFYSAGIKTLLGEYLSNGKGFATMLADSLGKAIYIPLLSNIPYFGDKIEGALISFILIIGLLFACFKLFFSLLMSYIQIILGLITSPLVIMMSALPGREGGVFGWLKNILSNILVFPAVIAIFLLADAIKNLTAGIHEPFWSPPFLIASTAQLTGALISYGLLLIASQVPSYIKALFEPKAKVTPPIAAFMGGVGAGLGAAKFVYKKTIGEKAEIAQKGYIDAKARGEAYTSKIPKWFRILPKPK